MNTIILDKSVKTRKSMQALDAPSKIKKNLITNKVTATFLISLCTSIAYMSFPRLTDLSRIMNDHHIDTLDKARLFLQGTDEIDLAIDGKRNRYDFMLDKTNMCKLSPRPVH